MKYSIKLVDKERKDVETIVVDQGNILEATVIVYKNIFYAFRSMSGRAFQDIEFQECRPPVYIESQS